MNNIIFKIDIPKNEPVYTYPAHSQRRDKLIAELIKQSSETVEIPVIVGGEAIKTGRTMNVVMPHNHKKVIAVYHLAGESEIRQAIDAALQAKKKWEKLSWISRASITLKAAELIAGKYRYALNAATMLGQGKNFHQSEIDAICETVDFLRFNAYYASEIYSEQPRSEANQLNRMEYRPLEGFVFAVTPFNFTAIGSNLNLTPVLMGNTTIWKPASTALLSNYLLMQIFKEAGLPDGVINFLPGSGAEISSIVLQHKDFNGLHFTGSNETFNQLWKSITNQLEQYRAYPRIVGETGGKDFIVVHPSADVDVAVAAIIRGAFEYQGQKCSAASRAYIPFSLWDKLRTKLLSDISTIRMGDVADFRNFMNAVIDRNAFKRIMNYIDFARKSADAEIIAGGNGDDSVGYFIEPTVILTSNPHFKTMQEEIFGPVITIYLYPDEKFDETLELCNQTSPYGLTGSIIASQREAIERAEEVLKYAAGNFYINDKPTGAMVGLQPFGGARASGTNDKAGGKLNLLRWVSPRTIKETLVPPTDYLYPFFR